MEDDFDNFGYSLDNDDEEADKWGSPTYRPRGGRSRGGKAGGYHEGRDYDLHKGPRKDNRPHQETKFQRHEPEPSRPTGVDPDDKFFGHKTASGPIKFINSAKRMRFRLCISVVYMYYL